MSQDPFGLRQGDVALSTETANEHNSPDLLGVTYKCGICDEALHKFQETMSGEVTWLHARDWMQHDHEPEPVETTIEEHPLILCDFCGVTAVLEWAFDGDVTQAKEAEQTRIYSHIWRACHDCAPMVMDSDIDGLSSRLMSVSPKINAIRFTSSELAEIKARGKRLHSAFIPTIYATRYIGPPVKPSRLTPQLLPKVQAGLGRFWHHPGLFELIGKRRCKLPGVHSGLEDNLLVSYSAGEVPEPVFRKHVHHVAAGIAVADLFWISDKFTSLAIIAGKDLTEFTLRREDLPSSFGLLVFARPIFEVEQPHGTAGVCAVSWTIVPGGIWLNLYIQGEDANPLIPDIAEWRSEWGYLAGLNVGNGLPWGEVPHIEKLPAENILCTVFATWLLLKQPGVAETSTVAPDKKLARAYHRAGRKVPEVRVVDLRRQPRPKASTHSRTGRKLEFRELRRGHWKWITYGPKHGQRRFDYVHQYLAGPDDAPMRPPKPTVKVLR